MAACIYSHLLISLRNLTLETNLFAKQRERQRCRQQLHGRRGGRVHRVSWESRLNARVLDSRYKIEGLPRRLSGKNLPAVRETWARSLGREDPLEEAMATHSSILAWRMPGTEEPGGPQSMGSQRVGHA